MGKIIDISGNRYGRLVVQKYTNQKDKYGKTLWECLCDCGKITLQNKSNLQRKSPKGIRSCGCIKTEYISKKYWKGCGEVSQTCWSHIKHGAESRKILFDITIQEMWELFIKQDKKCALTKMDIKLSRNYKREKPTASLDRIDPSKGYYKENCQWVHKIVNLCKHTLTNEEFINLCKIVTEQNG